MSREIVNIENLDAKKTIAMLGNKVSFSTEIDSKGR